MRFPRSLLLAGVVPLLAAAPPSDPPTIMTACGKLLLSDPLGAIDPGNWRAGKGKWEAKDGAVVGAELKSDNHAAVLRHVRTFRNAVIQFSFKLDGASQITMSLNAAKHHLNRVVINPKFFRVMKDDTDGDGPDKVSAFQTAKTTIEAGTWHTVVLELSGPEMVATLDGKLVVFGGDEKIDVDKSDLRFTVRGESAAFKDVRVWEATPNPEWPKTRAKLAAEATKSAAS